MNRPPTLRPGELCADCPDLAVRTLGIVPYCDFHLEAVLAPIRERVIEHEDFEGVFVRDGVDRTEYGAGFVDARCRSCGATAVAEVGTPCGWCDAQLEAVIAEQREMLLRPALPDADDVRFDAAIRAWAERLARAVEAELVTEDEARGAWNREVTRAAAA